MTAKKRLRFISIQSSTICSQGCTKSDNRKRTDSTFEEFRNIYSFDKSYVNESIHNITGAWLEASEILLNKTESVLEAQKENIFLKEVILELNETLSYQNLRIAALEKSLNVSTTTTTKESLNVTELVSNITTSYLLTTTPSPGLQ